MPRSKYAPTLGECLLTILEASGHAMTVHELSYITKESPRAIGRAMGQTIIHGKAHICGYTGGAKLALYLPGGHKRAAAMDEEPEEAIRITELAPGHRRVTFGTGWRPGDGQRHRQIVGGIQSGMNPGAGW